MKQPVPDPRARAKMSLGNVTRGKQKRPIFSICYGTSGVGKAQPLNSGVLTPSGFRPIGDLAVGDVIVAPGGGVQTVEGVFPRGVLPVFDVETSDGGKTVACGEHLWTTTDTTGRTADYTTQQIAETLTVPHGKWPTRRHRLPIVAPVDLEFSGEIPIRPYLLGLLLGDGCFSDATVIFHKPEKDLWGKIKSLLPDGDEVSEHQNRRCAAASIVRRGNVKSHTREALERLGLWGTNSFTKFVPEAYLGGRASDRLDLLRGLFDSDGHVRNGRRSIEFSTSSPMIRDAVTHIVRSLGGFVVNSSRTPQYTYRGEKRFGSIAYRQSVWFADDTVPVASEKNLAKWRDGERAPTYRTVKSVTPAGEAECVCIKVSNDDGLYVTDDFIVTHNTTFAAGANDAIFLCSEAGTAQIDVARFPSPESYADVLAALAALVESEHKFKTLVLDSLDWLDPLVTSHVCEANNWPDLVAPGYGKGPAAAQAAWLVVLRAIQRVHASGMHVVLLAHGQVRRAANPGEEAYDRYEMKLSPKVESMFREAADDVLFATFDTRVFKDRDNKVKAVSSGERILRTTWSVSFEAKNRHNLPETMPLSWAEYYAACEATGTVGNVATGDVEDIRDEQYEKASDAIDAATTVEALGAVVRRVHASGYLTAEQKGDLTRQATERKGELVAAGPVTQMATEAAQ